MINLRASKSSSRRRYVHSLELASMLSASVQCPSSFCRVESGESEGGHDDKANVPPLFLLPFPGLSSSPPSLHPSAGTIGFRFCPFATASDS